MSRRTRLRLRPYGISVIAVALALLLMRLLDSWIAMSNSPFLLFFGGVMVSAWYGGMGPGVLATVLSAMVSAYFFMSPNCALTSDLTNGVRLSLYVGEGVLFSGLVGALKAASKLALVRSGALLRSEERYRSIVETANEGIWLIDGQGRTEYVNQRMAEMLGYTVGEMGDRPMLDFTDNAGSVDAWLTIEQRQEGIKQQQECRFRRKDGSDLWTLVSTNAILNQKGEFIGSIAMITDISDRKQVEESLLESEKRFRNMADTAPVMLWMSGTDKLCYYFNKSWLDFTGRTLEQEMGNGWTEGVYPDDFQRCLDTYVSAFDARQNFQMEYRLRRFDGEYRWILGTGVPRFTPDGTFVGYIGSSIDINDRKQAEDSQRFLSEASTVLATSLDYETTLQNVARLAVPYFADSCVIHVVEEDKSLRQVAIAHVDPSRQELIEEIERRYPLDLERSPGYPRVLRTGESELISEIDDSLIHLLVRDADHLNMMRELKVTSHLCVPLKARARILGTMSFATGQSGRRYNSDDLTLAENIAVRAALAVDNAKLYAIAQRDRAAAEKANRTKDEFLATLSHELRTPLNAILGWAQLLRQMKFDEATKAKGLETIERNAKSQAKLIEDILDVSRIITGKIRLNVSQVSPISASEAAIDVIRPAADAKGIRLEAVLDPNAGPVSGDPDRLQQIVWNLLSNAVKFTPKQGRVQIRLERINSHVEITVSDTGIGIGAEFLPYVFDRFSQADSTSTRAYGGLGLGLAIVRHLVELHGGSVHVASPGKGQGATFTVHLPLAIVHTDVNNPERVHPTVGGELSLCNSQMLDGLRVLVVDDQPDALELLQEILQEFGAKVTAASSAREAIAAIAQVRPDVLVSDIEMPEEDGYALIRKVRALDGENGGHIPAAALTAYAREEDRRRALLAGFQMHIAKPVDPTELATVVASLAGRTGNV